jgi:putative transposase
MPRRPRMVFANTPHHITQRGHRGGDVFFSRDDRLDYLGTLIRSKRELEVRLFAYCLMSNHVHLVVDPGDDRRTLSELMRRLASRHARRLNRVHEWKGSLWSSRFHSSPIDTERYLLTCGRYVDMNPVRANLVPVPEAYEWSSYRARAGLVRCSWIDVDPALAGLAMTPTARAIVYRELIGAPIPDADLAKIRAASLGNHLTGDTDFESRIEERERIVVKRRSRGRPKRPLKKRT